jgi:folate/biopterin transporter
MSQSFREEHPQFYVVLPEDASFWTKCKALPKHPLCYVRRMNHNFGWRFEGLLTSAYLGVKGFLVSLLYTSLQPFFLYHMQLDGVAYQMFQNMALSPFDMKAFIGFVSDIFPIRGYNKRYHLAMVTLLGACCWLVLGLAPIVSAGLATVFYFLCTFQIAAVDLLVEGQYAKLMVAMPHTGSDCVTWVWVCYMLGSLLAMWVVGPLSDLFKSTQNLWYLKTVFLVATPVALQFLGPLAWNWLGEEQLPRERWGMQRDLWNRGKNVFVLALAMGCGTLLNVVVTLLNRTVAGALPEQLSYLPLVVWSVAVSVVLVVLAYRKMPTRQMAHSNLYMFLSAATYIQLSSLDIFYTGSENCIAGGPQFPSKYYITYAGTMQSFFGLIGVSLFQAVMGRWHFRPCFWMTTALKCGASLIEVAIILRWNLAIGIPDKVMYMVGNAIIREVVTMLDFMPAVVLTSKLCPRGMESTVYALLAGFQNFGQTVSRNIGTAALPVFGVKLVAKGPCEWDNLWLLVLVCHGLIPLVTIPLTFFLIPNNRLTDEMIVAPDDQRAEVRVDPAPDALRTAEDNKDDADAEEMQAVSVDNGRVSAP